MPTVSSCPEGHVFQQLLGGEIPLAKGEPLLRHLEACGRCAETVEQLMASDTVVDAIRRQKPPLSLEAGGVVQDLMTRLHGLRAAIGASSSRATIRPLSPGEEQAGARGRGETLSQDAAPQEAPQE